MSTAELIILGVVPSLAAAATFAAFTEVVERAARALTLSNRSDQLLAVSLAILFGLLVGLISLLDVNSAFAIQDMRSADSELTRVFVVRLVVVLEGLSLAISVVAAIVLWKREARSLTMTIILALLGNIGALIWMLRRRSA